MFKLLYFYLKLNHVPYVPSFSSRVTTVRFFPRISASFTPSDWHRLKGNRQAQAQQQLATALVFLLNNQPDEALAHINQAAGWLDRSISPLPCPGHGPKN